MTPFSCASAISCWVRSASPVMRAVSPTLTAIPGGPRRAILLEQRSALMSGQQQDANQPTSPDQALFEAAAEADRLWELWDTAFEAGDEVAADRINPDVLRLE